MKIARKKSPSKQRGFSHHLLLPVLAILFVGGIGSYLTFRSNAAPSSDSQSIRLATYNILGSSHKRAGAKIGGSVKDRAERATKVIKGKAGVKAFDIVGVQEMRPDQYRMFNKMLPGYNKYPKKSSQRTIYFVASRFQLLKGGSVGYPSYGDIGLNPGRTAPWVLLKDKKSGKDFYVINAHLPAFNLDAGSDTKGGALKRERGAKILHDWAKNRYAEGKPVFIIGDFNSGYQIGLNGRNGLPSDRDVALNGDRSRLPYCILTQNTFLQNTYDVSENRNAHCPIAEGGPIDHIYATPSSIRLLSWTDVPANNSIIRKASDHRPVVIEFMFKNGPAVSPEARSIEMSEDDIPTRSVIRAKNQAKNNQLETPSDVEAINEEEAF